MGYRKATTPELRPVGEVMVGEATGESSHGRRWGQYITALDRGAHGDAEELDPARGQELLGGEGGVREVHTWELRDNPWFIWIKT
jgi:hypothetical protein